MEKFILAFIIISIPLIIYKMARRLEKKDKLKVKGSVDETNLVDETNVEPKPLFCYDCKHCIKVVRGNALTSVDFSKCALTKQEKPKLKDYLVTGENVSSGEFQYNSCTYMRGEPGWQTIICGPDAKLFEPKEDVINK